MNAVEIEQAISELASQPFDPAEFPFAFLHAFGNKETTIKRLRSGTSNKSDVGGVLQTSNIHLAVAKAGEVTKTLSALKASPATAKAKARFVAATDGVEFEAEDIVTGETVACHYPQFPDHFGFLLPLAGISTIKEIKDNPIDVRATGRLNKLYVELLRENPEWATADRRHDMNHFMARLIFCFFAEDTDIFNGEGLFTRTVEQMSDRDAINTHSVISEIFRAMNIKTKPNEREKAEPRLPAWADQFPYVNGGLFSGSTDVPRFTKMARTYLLHAGRLKWREINPDIFGSMIQAVADDEERGELGLHYTSVPNILKVLNPLFLDDLRAKLDDAGDNKIKLLNLRKRMSRIRVFDPACGSGNFLVIAYKQLRAIEAEINQRRGEADVATAIPLTNFRGIELRDFPAEIARLALIIAEYQCDVLYRGAKLALAEFLPLDAKNWIVCGNALEKDWLSICQPVGKVVAFSQSTLLDDVHKQVPIDFENEGGETYICGNPPFTGTRKQSEEQKRELEGVFSRYTKSWKNVDYVGAWLVKAAEFNKFGDAPFAFVATNSLCQGQQVPITWAILRQLGMHIRFAYTSFSWSNLATNRAGVTVVIVGLDASSSGDRYLLSGENSRVVDYINPYLTSHRVETVVAARHPLNGAPAMDYGVYYSKSAPLVLQPMEARALKAQGVPDKYVMRFIGSSEFINGVERFCLWIGDEDLPVVLSYPEIKSRIDAVRNDRLATEDAAVRKLANRPHQFRERKGGEPRKFLMPIVSSENRSYLPAGLADASVIPTNKMFFMSEAPMWCLAIMVSRLHLSWIATICGRLRSDFSYSNTLGWNTFPIPPLSQKNKEDLSWSAENILLAREAHFPATIADLYDPENMPPNLREAHERNDEVIERIYVGRRFRNDTERLEKLFEMYTKMTNGKRGNQH